MAEPKHAPRRGLPDEDEEPEPLEAGLHGPTHAHLPDREEDLPPDDHFLLRVVEANGEHLRTMRWGLGLGTFVLVAYVAFGGVVRAALGDVVAGLAVLVVAGGLLGAGLQALGRQLDLLRRATAATDHFIFGASEDSGE